MSTDTRTCLLWALLIGAFVAWLLAVAVAGAR